MDQSTLTELLYFDPSAGRFTWRVDRAGGAKADAVAGGSNGCGYWKIWVAGKSYYAHRLAWLYVHGRWPEGEIDHIDGNGMNNAINNLREVTSAENKQNRRMVRSDKATGRRIGTRWSPEKRKWAARIGCDGKSYHIGYFETEESAYIAYLAEKEKLHPAQTLTRADKGLRS